MGFRGSRVQIPPSRLSEDQALQRLLLWGFFFVAPRAVSKAGRLSLNMKYVAYGPRGGATDDVSAGGRSGLAEVLDHHDIACDLVHSFEENPLPIRRDIKAQGGVRVSEIQRRDRLHAFGRHVEELDPRRRG